MDRLTGLCEPIVAFRVHPERPFLFAFYRIDHVIYRKCSAGVLPVKVVYNSY